MDPKQTPMHELTAGALDGLRGVAFDDLDVDGLVVVLTVLGDAVRLGMVVPRELSQAVAAKLGEARIRMALGRFAASVAGWALPAEPGQDEDDPSLEWALRRRDEAESVITAARRYLLPRGILIDGTEEASRLESEIAKHDLSCAGRVARSDAERMLGHRVALIGEHSWLDEIRTWADDDSGAAADEPRLDLQGAVVPSLETLEQYVIHGRFRRWVEAAAARSPHAAEDLRDMIATYREQKPVRVGIIARRWATETELVVPRQLARAAAGAGGLPKETSEAHVLGSLDPVDAEATMVVGATRLVLHVFPGETPLAEVSLDSVKGAQEAGSHTWTVELALDPSAATRPVRLRVVDGLGRMFETDLTIAALV